MKIKSILIFIAGFLTCAILLFIYSQTFSTTGFFASQLSAPSDKVSEDEILLYDDQIILKIPNATIAIYEPSGSMIPIFDNKAHGIRIVPNSSDEINVGDIISFRKSGELLVHRVAEKGMDNEGIYFITKGDANIIKDEKIRFDDIEYLTIGILW
ncbi:MAG: hypothetical protein WC548_04485 [Candidatus Pacearchaeota archaeon]